MIQSFILLSLVYLILCNVYLMLLHFLMLFSCQLDAVRKSSIQFFMSFMPRKRSIMYLGEITLMTDTPCTKRTSLNKTHWLVNVNSRLVSCESGIVKQSLLSILLKTRALFKSYLTSFWLSNLVVHWQMIALFTLLQFKVTLTGEGGLLKMFREQVQGFLNWF